MAAAKGNDSDAMLLLDKTKTIIKEKKKKPKYPFGLVRCCLVPKFVAEELIYARERERDARYTTHIQKKNIEKIEIFQQQQQQ